jgi:hypothetical protein
MELIKAAAPFCVATYVVVRAILAPLAAVSTDWGLGRASAGRMVPIVMANTNVHAAAFQTLIRIINQYLLFDLCFLIIYIFFK